MRLAPWAACLCAALGCSASSHAPTTVDAGATDASGTLDASSSEDASLPVDAGSRDAAIDVGAALDAGDAPPSSHWCDGQLHAYCDDFDEDPLMQGWQSVDEQHGSVSLDGASYTSPALSFLAQTTSLATGAAAVVRLGKRTSEIATEIHLAFDVRADALDPTGVPVAISSIHLFDAQSEAIETVDVVLTSTGARVDDHGIDVDGGAGLDASYPLSAASLTGAWSRIQIDLALARDAGVGGGTLTVWLGSTAVVDHVAMGPSSQPALPLIFLGAVTGVGPAAAMAVRFDDVTFDALAN